ncbi:MAG: lytic transglycosylase domain-containing protein, partial [Alphaproteobacteria bacterium]|nr:lytic transglycosylase domain-containing protein [Alphaproteobacteria bacterium]
MAMRTAILVAAAAILAGAQAPSLPPGLTQNGTVIMMQPIQDGSESGPESSGERHAGRAFLSQPDHDIFTRAFEAADHGDWTAARALAAQGRDSAAKRLVEWRYSLDKNSGAPFSEIDAFLRANPDWPMRDTLAARAEAVLDLNMTPAQIVAWFGNRQPASGIGKIRLGEALIATGRAGAGREMIREAWIKSSFEPEQELAIVQKDGALLTPDIDRQRLNNLLWHDDVSGAKRELARATIEAQRLAQTRLLLRTNPVAGEREAQDLSADLASDPDLLFDRARTARRAGDNPRAEQLMLRALAATRHDNSPKLWAETNIVAREALKDGDYRTAYQLVDHCDLTSGDALSECEFMAGWIALRFLKEARLAQPHFQKLEAAVSRPISLARAHYWEGRSYEALGDLANAWEQYHLAAKAPATYYGQIALARIDATPVLHIQDKPAESANKAEFEQDDLVHVMRVLADLGQVGLLRSFALRYAELHPEPRQMASLSQMLVESGFREVAVRVAKQASYANVLFLTYTHPVIDVPAYRGPGSGPETAVVLGLIRQETEFDPAAVSAPGARGIMQIMPATARHTAAVAGIPFRPNDLSDPTYNMQLGMAEFAGDLSDWNGSLVLAAAAYNAGPNNVKKWLNSNGDPRSPACDPIDWIEQIPFNETRNYVQRIIENTQIYRNRLAGRDLPLKIMADLYAPNP